MCVCVCAALVSFSKDDKGIKSESSSIYYSQVSSSMQGLHPVVVEKLNYFGRSVLNIKQSEIQLPRMLSVVEMEG